MAPLDASRLEALLESAELLHGSLHLDELLRHLLRTVMGRLLVTRACIGVTDQEGAMRVSLARGVSGLTVGQALDAQTAAAAGMALVLPIGAPPIGLLGVAAPSASRLEEERSFINALLGIASSALANARAHSEAERLAAALGQRVQELRTLLDMVQGFAAAREPEDVAQLLALSLAGRWAVSRYLVVAWMQGHPMVQRTRGMSLDDPRSWEPWLGDWPEAVSVADLPADDERGRALRDEKAVLVLPIRSAAVRGFVLLGPRPAGLAFPEAGREFAAALVAQAAVAFENAWRLRETLARRRVEQELALAASIQQGLFPASLPAWPGYELAAFNRPASQVGGDYYDAISAAGGGPAGPCLLCVADVSGKGLPASLLMSTIQATFRALHGRAASLVDLVEETNALLYATTPGNKYATAILARIDPASGIGSYVNAGHTRGLLVHANGEVEALEPCGPPIGLLPGIGWDEKPIALGPGDRLALFSDGVTEAWNSAEDEFGENRVVHELRSARAGPAELTVSRLVAAIDAFAGPAAQHDDITMMLLARLR
jgi:sigma-B regulation protein RsbU (phosphoserine phosphatase)